MSSKRREGDDPTPLVSIVIATLNAVDHLPRCLDSIRSQTLPESEIDVVVMDGGSTDGTVDLLRQRASELGYWESGTDSGIAQAWNKALGRARGEWVLFLGADDVLAAPRVLETVSAALRNSAALVVFGMVKMRGGPWDDQLFGDSAWAARFDRRMSVPHQATFARRTSFDAFGVFDSSFKIVLDYEWLLRFADERTVEHCPVLVSIMGGDGVSARQIPRALNESARAQLRHSPRRALTIAAAWAGYRLRHAWRTNGFRS